MVIVPLISGLPLWWRFMQCLRKYKDTQQRFPHVANAGKYALAFSVVLFGLFHSELKDPDGMSPYKAVWILFMVASTLYTFAWDVTMDWDLGKRAHGGLREHLMYRSKWPYYTCIVIDLLLRYGWTLTLIPRGTEGPLPESVMLYLDPGLAAAEIMRRSMWGCFRLENEHLHSTLAAHRGGPQTFVPLHFDVSEGERPQTSKRACQVIMEAMVMAGFVLAIGGIAAITARSK